jgi:Na+/proline symporter
MTARIALWALGGTNAALVTFLAYTLAVFGLAWLSNRLARGKSFLSDYFLGNRALGMWAFALTFAATSASGGSFTGFPSKIYTHGWILALWIASYMVVPICAMGLLAKRINQVARLSGAITVPDVLRDRFRSTGFGLLATLLIVFFVSFNLVAQFKSGGKILETLLQDAPLYHDATIALRGAIENLQWDFLRPAEAGYYLCLIVFAVAVVAYTTYGGFKAVVWTDVMQGFVMVLGVVILLPLAIAACGGLGSATRQMAAMIPPAVGQARLELLPGTAGPYDVTADTWISVARDDELAELAQRIDDAQARIAQWAMPIAAGTATPEQFAAQRTTAARLEQLRRRADELRAAPPLILYHVDAAVRVPRSGAADNVRVTCIRTPHETALQLLRLRVAALGDRADESTRQARAALQSHIDRLQQTHEVPQETEFWQPLAVPLTVRQFVPRDYRYGYDQPGVYVTGPGPHPADDLGFLPLSVAISFFFMWAISGAGQPSSMVRLMAFNNSMTLRRSIFTVAVYYSLIYFPLVIIFCCARVFLPAMEANSDAVMPRTAVYLSHYVGAPWLAGVVIAAPFAAVMSTVDSFLLLCSSAVVRDIYQRNINPQASQATLKRLSYLTTLLIGGGAMLGAVNPPQFLQDIIVYTGSGLAACFLGPMAYALYWPRVNKQGAIAGMLAGFLAHLAMHVIGMIVYGSFFRPATVLGFEPVVVGLLVSFATVYVVSRLTPPPPVELVRKYFCR